MDTSGVSMERGMVSTQGVNPSDLPAMPRDGSTQCLSRCRCDWVFVPIDDDLAEAWWTRLSKAPGWYIADLCPDCLGRAANWTPWGVVSM